MHVDRRLASILLALTVLAVVAPSAATVTAATSDPLGAELMRLTNLDRQALGLKAMAIDSVLAGYTHDTAWTCPSQTSMTIDGRAVDMATRGYFAHTIKGCLKSDGTEYSTLEIMYIRFGYNTNRGENIAYNKGFSTITTVMYYTGCPLDSTLSGSSSTCPGAATDAIKSVAVAERGFMNSPGHRANLTGNYDRFGCGSGTASDGGVYYACVFSLGGPTTTTTTTTTTVSGDTTRPRVTDETGKWSTLRRWSGHRFYATLADNRWLRMGRVLIDGHRVKTRWWTTHSGYHRMTVRIRAWRMSPGRHVLYWRARDGAGNRSTWSDGKVVFYVR